MVGVGGDGTLEDWGHARGEKGINQGRRGESTKQGPARGGGEEEVG